MGISLSQLIIAAVLVLLLVGKFPNIVADLTSGLQQLRKLVKDGSDLSKQHKDADDASKNKNAQQVSSAEDERRKDDELKK